MSRNDHFWVKLNNIKFLLFHYIEQTFASFLEVDDEKMVNLVIYLFNCSPIQEIKS